MRINTILPDYVSRYGGPTYVCNHILEAMFASGTDVRLYSISGDNGIHKPFHHFSMPLWARPLGYRLFSSDTLAKYTEWRYLHSLKKHDVAYIWNSTSMDTYKAVKKSGHIMVTENVNTHRASSKRILDAEYKRLGLSPNHGIDDKSIAHESAQLELVDFVFSPSPEVTRSLLDADVPESKIIRTSYGIGQNNIVTPQVVAARTAHKEFTAVFVGRIGIRKGVHLLLDYWTKAGIKGKLKLVGIIEQNARHLLEPYLGKHNIELVPFMKDLSSLYLEADVFLFPSLEEGSPLVTYLALGAGLPSIVSPMGGDGIINHGQEGLIIDAHNADEWINSIRLISSDSGLRSKMADNAYNKAGEFLWSKVGKRRADSLRDSISNSGKNDRS